MKKSAKPATAVDDVPPAGLQVRADWTALCRAIWTARGHALDETAVPRKLRYLLDEPIRSTLFYLLEPTRERALVTSGRSRGLPIRRRAKRVTLVKDWRWRLEAAGCDAAYPFATIGDGTPWL